MRAASRGCRTSRRRAARLEGRDEARDRSAGGEARDRIARGAPYVNFPSAAPTPLPKSAASASTAP